MSVHKVARCHPVPPVVGLILRRWPDDYIAERVERIENGRAFLRPVLLGLHEYGRPRCRHWNHKSYRPRWVRLDRLAKVTRPTGWVCEVCT